MATATPVSKTPQQVADEQRMSNVASQMGAAGKTEGQSQTLADQYGQQTQNVKPPAEAATPVSKDPNVQTKPAPPTAGSTTPAATPASSVGSNLPQYAAAYNAPWMQQANNIAKPGENTAYNPTGSVGAAGADYNKANYDPSGTQAPSWQDQGKFNEVTYNDKGAQWNDEDGQWNGSTQWNQPGGSSQAAYDALQSILGGDASGMDTSAMKNKLKEQALQMQKDQMMGSQQAAAGRGMLGSGYQAGQERRIGNETNKSILGNFRDIDIAAADASVKNKLAGSEALNSLLTGDTGRENTAFQAKLLGEDTGFKNRLAGADTSFKNKLVGADTAFKNQLAGADTAYRNNLLGQDTGFKNQLEASKFKEGQNQFGANFNLQKQNDIMGAADKVEGWKQAGAASQLAKWGAGTDAQLKGQDQDLQVANQKTNEMLGRLGLAVNLEEIKNSSQRDKQQFMVDIFRTLVQNEQHNAQMGLSYGQLGQNMNEMIANLSKSIGM